MLTHTAHGDGVASLLPYVMEFNRPVCIDSFAQIARMLDLGDACSDAMTICRAILIDEVARLLASVGIPRTLKDLGLAADQATMDRRERNRDSPPGQKQSATAGFARDASDHCRRLFRRSQPHSVTPESQNRRALKSTNNYLLRRAPLPTLDARFPRIC